jgi:putative restriction endonuclease
VRKIESGATEGASKRIKEEFDNGKEYYALHGSQILLSKDRDAYPGPDFLARHNQSIYRD